MGGEYTTVKIPRKYRRSLDLVRTEISRQGLDNKLLEYLKEDTCPFCNTKLKSVEELHLKYAELKECPKCGFSKPVIESRASIRLEDLLTIFGAGLLFGIGLFLLAKTLRR
jgi:hypothetical protein